MGTAPAAIRPQPCSRARATGGPPPTLRPRAPPPPPPRGDPPAPRTAQPLPRRAAAGCRSAAILPELAPPVRHCTQLVVWCVSGLFCAVRGRTMSVLMPCNCHSTHDIASSPHPYRGVIWYCVLWPGLVLSVAHRVCTDAVQLAQNPCHCMRCAVAQDAFRAASGQGCLHL